VHSSCALLGDMHLLKSLTVQGEGVGQGVPRLEVRL